MTDITPNDVYAELLNIIPRELVFRYGIQFDCTIDLKAGFHEYKKTRTVHAVKTLTAQEKSRFLSQPGLTQAQARAIRDGRESIKARLIIWASISIGSTKDKHHQFFAITGPGNSWSEALKRFKADMKLKLKERKPDEL